MRVKKIMSFLYIPPFVPYTGDVPLFLIMIRFLIQMISLPILTFFRRISLTAAPIFPQQKLKLVPQRIRFRQENGRAPQVFDLES